MGKNNRIKELSFLFAIRIVKLNLYLTSEKKEFNISRQIMRSGTSVGALVRESENAESKLDFIHKLAIAQKEINETIYWIDLLYHTNFLNKEEYESLNFDAKEIYAIFTQIIKTSKANLNK